MEQQHTPEPRPSIEAYTTNSVRLDGVDYIRARACVNACAGIPTDVLEEPDTEGQDLARRAWDKFDSVLSANELLRKQRDELLAELEFQRDRNYNPFEPDNQCKNYERLCAFIAGVKGGAE